MNLREAAQQALEALDSMYGRKPERVEKVITALRVALADGAMQRLTDVQQEMDCYGDGNVYRGQRSSDSKTQTITINGMPAVEGPLSKAHRISQESRQVEPVAWSYPDARGRTVVVIANTAPYDDAKPLYSAPPKRKPLTEEELSDVVSNETRGHLDRDTYTYALVCMIARAMEREHGIWGEK